MGETGCNGRGRVAWRGGGGETEGEKGKRIYICIYLYKTGDQRRGEVEGGRVNAMGQGRTVEQGRLHNQHVCPVPA